MRRRTPASAQTTSRSAAALGPACADAEIGHDRPARDHAGRAYGVPLRISLRLRRRAALVPAAGDAFRDRRHDAPRSGAREHHRDHAGRAGVAPARGAALAHAGRRASAHCPRPARFDGSEPAGRDASGIERALRLAPQMAERARSALADSQALIEQSQQEIRTVSYLLHPPMLDEMGLPSALRWYMEGFTKRSGIAVDISVAAPIEGRRFPFDIEAALFRVLQECMTNVHRHSGSNTARIEMLIEIHIAAARNASCCASKIEARAWWLRRGPGAGGGRTAHSGVVSIGVGLAGMRERLRQLGGNLEIWSSPRGTTVRASDSGRGGGRRPPCRRSSRRRRLSRGRRGGPTACRPRSQPTPESQRGRDDQSGDDLHRAVAAEHQQPQHEDEDRDDDAADQRGDGTLDLGVLRHGHLRRARPRRTGRPRSS